MTDLSKKLIDCIKEGKTINEISMELGLSNKQLFNMLSLLKNKGIDFNRKYYETGDIIYTPKKKIDFISLPKENVLYTLKDSKKLTMVVIADIHIGSTFENLTYLDQLYDYCIKENIHVIINCGDILDGTFGSSKKEKDGLLQIDSFLKQYPFDKNIINVTVLGNHDFSILENMGINFEEVLNSYRHDFLTLGYHQGILKIKNDFIVLEHKKTSNHYPCIENMDSRKGYPLVLEGHHHHMGLKVDRGATRIYVPSLSDMTNSLYHTDPGMLLMEASFTKGFISSICLEERRVKDGFQKANEFYLDLLRGKNTSLSEIEYEEEGKQLIKTKG